MELFPGTQKKKYRDSFTFIVLEVNPSIKRRPINVAELPKTHG